MSDQDNIGAQEITESDLAVPTTSHIEIVVEGGCTFDNESEGRNSNKKNIAAGTLVARYRANKKSILSSIDQAVKCSISDTI